MMAIHHVEAKHAVHQNHDFSKRGLTTSGGRWWEVHAVWTIFTVIV